MITICLQCPINWTLFFVGGFDVRKIRYISLSVFILGVIFFVCPDYSILALESSYNNDIVSSISGEGTEQDFKDIYAETMLAQAIIDGGQVDFSSVDTPIGWIDFVDSITTPILQTIDDASPVDTNLAGLNSRINECLLDYYTNGIVRNMNSSLTVPNSVGNVFSQMMRSKAQKSYIGGGGTSVGETLLQIAKDFYLMNEPATEQETYLPQDYLWFQNVNTLYLGNIEFMNAQFYARFSDTPFVPNNPLSQYSYYIVSAFDSHNNSVNPHISGNASAFSIDACLPKLIFSYNTTTKSFSSNAFTPNSSVFSTYQMMRIYKSDTKFIVQNQGAFSFNIPSSFESIDTCLNWIYSHFYNIDLFVNGEPWTLTDTHIDSFSFGGVTVDRSNNPMGLNIPDFYSFDYGRFKDIILDAINHSSVVMYEDIADCFLDINGQTCIATYSVVRNDYDDLVSEQFNIVSYPRFNSDLYTKTLVDQFRDDTSAGVQIIKNSYSIYPQSLTDALLYCGLLILFGLLIRRFLE